MIQILSSCVPDLVRRSEGRSKLRRMKCAAVNDYGYSIAFVI